MVMSTKTKISLDHPNFFILPHRSPLFLSFTRSQAWMGRNHFVSSCCISTSWYYHCYVVVPLIYLPSDCERPAVVGRLQFGSYLSQQTPIPNAIPTSTCTLSKIRVNRANLSHLLGVAICNRFLSVSLSLSLHLHLIV